LGEITQAPVREPLAGLAATNLGGHAMTWTKPEIEVVDVTLEITAYVARR
jgi:coenzyme PQQ precursor peptide PqqA